MELSLVQKIIIWSLPVIFAITVHEAAHGYVARYFGDMTAQRLGRISLNPLRHIDLVGTLLLPALTLALGGILFGWAKPVPVDFSRLRRPKEDMLWVALAGPFANFLMALLWAMLGGISAHWSPFFAIPLGLMSEAGVVINSVLMLLNLIPLPPLDGGRMAVSLLPPAYGYYLARLERFGFLILLALLLSGVLGILINPPLEWMINMLLQR